MIAAQIAAVFADLDVRAVKIGNAGDNRRDRYVADSLARFCFAADRGWIRWMVAKSQGCFVVKRMLFSCLRPGACCPHGGPLLTPNLPEARFLLNVPVGHNRGRDVATGEGPCRLRRARRGFCLKGWSLLNAPNV